MKVLFVDFDGVLVPFQGVDRKKRPALAAPECVSNLNSIVEKTGAKVVVSSSWRLFPPLEALAKLMKGWGFTGEVIDKTPHRKETRGHEILSWLDENDKIDAFVVLDDDASDLHLVRAHLVATDPMRGLTEENVQQAVELLNYEL